MVVSLLAILLVCYVMAKGGIMLYESGMKMEEEELTQDSKDRVVEYKAWLKGTGKKGKIKFAKTCIEGEHSPMVLFNREDPRKVDCVICSKCTDTLPMAATFSCGECSAIGLDGYLHVDPCTRHDKEPALR